MILLPLAMAGCRGEGAYPSRPIMLICPWSPGGGTDTVSRKVAELLERELEVPVNVVNATGGQGVTGHRRGARARLDGYTITMTTVELNMLHWRGLTTIGPDDFRPVMLLNRDDAALFVRSGAPWRSLAELREAIAADPRGLVASGTSQGGIWHISLAGWLLELGMPADAVIWKPISGAGPSLQDLMAGGVDMVCCSLPEAASLLDAGEVRCLGVMADERVPMFPEVPTFREQEFDWSMGGWRGLALPAGVPDDRAETIVAAVDRVVHGEEYREFMRRSGFNVSIAPPAGFRELMEDFDRRMGEILTSEAFRSVRRTRYGPLVFPEVIAAALVASLVALVLRGGLKTPEDAEPMTRGGLARMAMAVAFVAAYLALAEIAGYVITATVSLAALLLALRVRWPLAVGVSVLLVPLTYQVFAVGLRVPLPWGWLGW